MTLDYQRAAKILGDEYQALGYKWRLEPDAKHPKFYLSSSGVERFAILSSTSNYDKGGLLKKKRLDIQRDVIPHLPIPIPPPTNAVSREIPKYEDLDKSQRVHSMKIFMVGNGILSITLPKEVVPLNCSKAKVFLTKEGNHLGLQFTQQGKKYSATRGEGTVAFRFGRKEVPFEYAKKAPVGYKAPSAIGRLKGDSFVCDTPFPQELITGVKPKISERFSLTDGKAACDIINDWLKWAKHAGYEPEVKFRDNEVKINITEKITKTL